MARHWSELTADPNSSVAREHRRKTLEHARAEPVSDRVAYLCGLARGKKVLDIGVVDHELNSRPGEVWLHGEIAKAGKSVLGVDILPKAVEDLKARGYNVLLRDVTADPLDEKFELITCGEVIEHLGNPGGLLKAARKMLLPGGRLVLTTPNPYFASRVRDSVTGRFHESVDHVTFLFPSGVAELAEREGLMLDKFQGILTTRARRPWGKLQMAWSRATKPVASLERFCRSMIFEVVLPDN